MNQCMTDYIGSFIKAMEKNDMAHLLLIELEKFVECEGK